MASGQITNGTYRLRFEGVRTPWDVGLESVAGDPTAYLVRSEYAPTLPSSLVPRFALGGAENLGGDEGGEVGALLTGGVLAGGAGTSFVGAEGARRRIRCGSGRG